MNVTQSLINAGLTNSLFNYGDLAAAKPSHTHAFCTSDVCRYAYKYKYKLKKAPLRIQKLVFKSADNCPDCGYALLWGKKYGKTKN